MYDLNASLLLEGFRRKGLICAIALPVEHADFTRRHGEPCGTRQHCGAHRAEQNAPVDPVHSLSSSLGASLAPG